MESYQSTGWDLTLDKRRQNKFSNILPDNYNIFTYHTDSPKYLEMLIYIAEEKQDLNINKLDLDIIVGYISFVLAKKDISDEDELEDTMTITYVYINDEYKLNGIGKYLILLSSEYAKNNNIKKIELDDDSDNAWTKYNIYINLGLKYINTKPNPEMCGDTSCVLNKWTKFRNKYTNRDFFLIK